VATLRLSNVDFNYSSPYTPVFTDLSLSIETEWKTALIGRNGRGKTTLLRLLSGELKPLRGELSVPLPKVYFPFAISATERSTLEVVRECIAPFEQWEREMEGLLANEDPDSMMRYGELLERYQQKSGYTIDSEIEREFAAIGIPPALLEQRFSTLSGGERTRALIVALFLHGDAFPLIDEPTSHLDLGGRAALAGYLARQRSFLLVSHDRELLDRCADHVVSINRSDVRVIAGNYSHWKAQMEIEEEQERRRDQNLRREINSLEDAAQKRRTWSDAREREKTSAPDSGFVSHRAAKQMKRALAIESRIESKLAEKRELLRNHEQVRSLKLGLEQKLPELILSIEHASIEIEGRSIVRDFSLTLHRGERVALIGPNGSGKTTLLRAVAGEIGGWRGIIHLPKHLGVARARQQPLWHDGLLRDHLRESRIDETRFRTILGALNVSGEIFDRPLETFSQGERKKVELCRTFVGTPHLLLWDEPMNYIDLLSREQIEQAVIEYEPTMLFVEHDRRFIEKIATRIVELVAR
jgi:lincosamide and streptogramin A transport system ATP-binding/permease protein